ncbi:hypothetical protein BOX15_Mlig014148g2 [Macrostomum lignano]|uniref:Uncharacterized protein n=2 Tax=Macrostomum lignano TaxID=282301 RepID=A0A267G2R6_9PLAT|nr:hypothetical protein BOX15_Mlig014148g3 [Macrostomum lignano]PAA80381.1 hypothetical protein BOX15_Mlig014148g2 [Macrostomum lignano]
MALVGIHDCTRLHEENERLKKRIQQLRVERTELERELAGFRERQRIEDILEGHVRKRTSMTQTEPCDLDGGHLGGGRRGKRASESEVVEKLLTMQQQARILYEKELKKGADHVQMITAQNGKILELQKELTKAERQVKQLENDKLKLKKQLSAVSDSRVQSLQRKIDALKEENANLRSELRGLDSDFFNEIEDIKFALDQAVRLNQRYEKCFQHLCSKYGIPLDSWQLGLRTDNAV